MGKTALLTGGATGLAKQISIALAKQNMNLVINYKSSKQQAEELQQELETAYGVNVTLVQGDVSKSADVKRISHAALDQYGCVDILIHSAGPIKMERETILSFSEEEWGYYLNGNLSSAFHFCKHLVPAMRERKWGRIITFGFDRVDTAPAWVYRGVYASAKTGLASFTKTLAMEEYPNGITVNMIAPGDIRHPWKEATIAEAKETGSRPGTGEDVARVVSFLVDENSDYITGAVIPVAGTVQTLTNKLEN